MQELFAPSNVTVTPLYSGAWLRISSISLTLGPKSIQNYEFIDRTSEKQPNSSLGSISLVPIIKYAFPKPKKLVVIANFRIPLANYILEFPGGMVESQNFENDAFRELKEETGFIGKKILNKEAFTAYYDGWKSRENGKLLKIEIDGEDERNSRPVQELKEEEEIRVILLDFDRFLIRRLEEICRKYGFLVADQLYSFALGLETAAEMNE